MLPSHPPEGERNRRLIEDGCIVAAREECRMLQEDRQWR